MKTFRYLLLLVTGSVYAQTIPSFTPDEVIPDTSIDNVYHLLNTDPDGTAYDCVTNDCRYRHSVLDGTAFKANIVFDPSTDINITTDTIAAPAIDSQFASGMSVRYDEYYGGGNVAPAGIVDGQYYWVNISGLDITLHDNREDSLTGSNKVNITGTGTGTEHVLSRGCGVNDNAFVEIVGINTTTDVFTVVDHGFTTGWQMYWNGGGTGTPGGITSTQNKADSWVNVTGLDTFTLHATYEDAIAGTNPIDITSAQSGRLERGRAIYPLRVYVDDVQWAGGVFDGGIAEHFHMYEYRDPISSSYCNNATFLLNNTSVENFEVEGIAIINSWDGFKATVDTCDDAAPSVCSTRIFKDSYIFNCRDDCIENDNFGSFQGSDLLIERGFACFSMTNSGSGPDQDQSSLDSLEFTDFICDLKAKDNQFFLGNTEPEHISPIKISPYAFTPRYTCVRCYWGFEFWDSSTNASWDNTWDLATSFTDSYLLYTAGDTLPVGFPDPTAPPYSLSGITVLTGQAAHQKLREVKEAWWDDHQYVYNGDSDVTDRPFR